MGTGQASDLAGNTSQESYTDYSASSTLNTDSISNPLDIADTRGEHPQIVWNGGQRPLH
jgi:hypothetical protein